MQGQGSPVIAVRVYLFLMHCRNNYSTQWRR